MRACRLKGGRKMAHEALKKLRKFSCAESCEERAGAVGLRCDESVDCPRCLKATGEAASALLDEVEKRLMPEGMEWPRFEDGEPVRIGDAVESKFGTAFEVEYVEFCSDHANLYAPSEGLFSVEYGERVKRPEPEDTQERIDEDAGKTPCEYFGREGVLCSYRGGCPSLKMDCSCDMAKTRDLLRRQRELDAKGAGRC